MNRKAITACLALAVLLQITVLVSEYLGAVYPLWTGEEIKLKVIPVDPRSLFRGNYARLRYEISSIEIKEPGEKKEVRKGDFVYIRLRSGPEGLSVFDGVSFERPGSGPFLRGRLEESGRLQRNGRYGVRYGIEAFFAPEKKAKNLEKELRQGGIAVVMIAGNGKATLKDVISGGIIP